ncbi:MAG: hypothetical protein IT159_04555 [Bryobacterales bacterium]|nr:hypothetical protein [Bryobacterales bacterium]
MKNLLPLLLMIALATGLLALAADTASEKLILKSKMGNVTFLHAKHAEREKGDCKVCHDKLWPQSATAPLGWAAGMHKPAEAKKTSCGACHHPKGPAFSSVGNCTNSKCHVKG